MSKQFAVHETVAWARQRLDDLDTIISEVEKKADGLKDDARAEADAALARLEASRTKLHDYYNQLRTDADAVKNGVENAQDVLETEWIEVESAFQSFVHAARDQTETIRDVVVARAEAQRRSWGVSFDELRRQAEDIVDRAHGEFDAAIRRLTDEAEKFQTRIGEAKDAGDESWTAVKAGLADAKFVHDRTIQKIRDAFSKVL